MFSQLLDKKESGEFLPEGAEEASLPANVPAETTVEEAEEE